MRAAARLAILVASLSLSLAAADKPDPSWEALKSLVGDWQGTYEGRPSTVAYRLVSSGTALMETLEAPDSTQMITVYHPDGASLLMTHYCSMGNQSRMRSQGLRDGRLDFAYVDSTNLKSPGEHRMTRLVMRFPDPEHLVQEWTSTEGTKEHVGRFEFTRRK